MGGERKVGGEEGRRSGTVSRGGGGQLESLEQGEQGGSPVSPHPVRGEGGSGLVKWL